jgi:hypothetical protein
VVIQYRNGANAAFDAQRFDIDVANIGVDPENVERQPQRLIGFSYTGRSGEEVPLYFVPAGKARLTTPPIAGHYPHMILMLALCSWF